MKIAKRAGPKANVALARKCAVVLHRMLSDESRSVRRQSSVACLARSRRRNGFAIEQRNERKDRNRLQTSFRACNRHHKPSSLSFAGTNRSGQTDVFSREPITARLTDRSTSSANPIMLAAQSDHGQKHDPATGTKKGIDYRGPVTEG